MILEKDMEVVESSGFSSTKTAEIKATPAMLRMLSSGIYSDKISAFIRELSTNAYDAMVEAGTIKDKTFVVHLPTKLEPWFNIRDYGTGLSTNGMENNFSNFGDGTKAESNVYNGAFGLGSKSPLSYTRDFTIISYYNNTKTFYNYGLNDENIPMLSTAFSQPSDEPSGLEIQIAINAGDIDEVQRKAELIYRYFDKRPETNIAIDYHELPKLIEGNGWYLTKPDVRRNSYGGSYEQSTPTRIVMGNVIYPITSSGLSSSSKIYPMTMIPFVIKVNIGDVQMTPSRETLEMTPKTIKLLESKYKEIISELNTNLESKLDQSLCAFDKILSAFGLARSLPSGIKSFKIGSFIVPSNTYADVFEFPKGFGPMCTFKRFSKESTYQYRKTQEYYNKWRPINDSDYMFVVVDSNKRIGEVTNNLKAKYKHIYTIRPKGIITIKSKIGLDVFTDMAKKFLESCGNPKCVWASQEEDKLPPIVRAKPQPKVAGALPKPKVKGNIKVFPVLSLGTYITWNKEETIFEADLSNYYYVKSYKGNLMDSAGNSVRDLFYCLPKMIEDLEKKLGKSLSVVVVSGRYIERVIKDSRFINLLDEISKQNFVIEDSSDYNVIKSLVNKHFIDGSVRQLIQKSKHPSTNKLTELFTLVGSSSINQQLTHKSTFMKFNYTFKDVKTIDLVGYEIALNKYSDLRYLNYLTTPEVLEEFISTIDNRTQNINKIKQKD